MLISMISPSVNHGAFQLICDIRRGREAASIMPRASRRPQRPKIRRLYHLWLRLLDVLFLLINLHVVTPAPQILHVKTVCDVQKFLDTLKLFPITMLASRTLHHGTGSHGLNFARLSCNGCHSSSRWCESCNQQCPRSPYINNIP